MCCRGELTIACKLGVCGDLIVLFMLDVHHRPLAKSLRLVLLLKLFHTTWIWYGAAEARNDRRTMSRRTQDKTFKDKTVGNEIKQRADMVRKRKTQKEEIRGEQKEKQHLVLVHTWSLHACYTWVCAHTVRMVQTQVNVSFCVIVCTCVWVCVYVWDRDGWCVSWWCGGKPVLWRCSSEVSQCKQRRGKDQACLYQPHPYWNESARHQGTANSPASSSCSYAVRWRTHTLTYTCRCLCNRQYFFSQKDLNVGCQFANVACCN